MARLLPIYWYQPLKTFIMNTIEFSNRFESFRPLFMGFSMKLTRDVNNAADLLQESFLKAFECIDRFEEGTNFKAWMSTIIRNTFINNYRKIKVRINNADKVRSLSPVETTNAGSSNIEMERITSYINMLPEDQSVPFMMYFEGYQYDEIAEIVNVPIGTIKSRIFYARKFLKNILSGEFNAMRA